MIKAKLTMSPITQVNSSCLDWNRQGYFVLPTDSYQTYSDRVLQHKSRSVSATAIPIYDLTVSWVPIEYSNVGLRLWEAGCTWYEEDPESCPTIQLNSHFEHSSTYLGIYHKDEVLAHECVHAARVGLRSSSFEEIFAYLVSYTHATSLFGKVAAAIRVALGPLFEHTWESLVVVLFFAALLLALLGELYTQSSYILPVAVLALAMTAYFFARLCVRWLQWWKCKWHLDTLLKAQASSLPLMVRLTDDEIILFSHLQPAAIQQWIADQAQDFRWELLSKAYLP
jgi:hypothetical protein